MTGNERGAGRGGKTALVLSGGGARAAYQVGILRHIGERRPDDVIPIITGVSAGAINATHLAAFDGSLRDAARDLDQRWRMLTPERIYRSDPFTMLSIAIRWIMKLGSGGTRLGPRARSLLDTRPLRRFLENAVDLDGIDRNLRSGRLHAAAVSATCFETGQTITFVQGDPSISLWERGSRRAVRDRITIDHVMASSALPLLFPAESLGGYHYGDGSLRQTAPLAPAIHLGADRILSISARYDQSSEEIETPTFEGYPAPAQVLGVLFNNIFLDNLDADADRLERVNAVLEDCGDGKEAGGPRTGAGLRTIDLLMLRPSEDLGRLASEYEDRLPRAIRFLVGGLGSRKGHTADFVSYMLFEESYIARLIEMGARDAEAQWPRIESFLDRETAAASPTP